MQKRTIPKFEREMLHEKNIHIRKKAGNSSFHKHWHSYFEIIFYRNCKGYCILNNKSYEIAKNCLFLLTPQDFHEINTEYIPDSSSIIISFDEQMIDNKIFESIAQSPIVLHSVSHSLSDEIELLADVFKGDAIYRDNHLYHLLNHILICILNDGQMLTDKSHPLNPIIRESIAYMLTNPEKQHSLETFSAKYGITKTYFSRLFHSEMGIPFKQYLTELRINCAKSMLSENPMSIIDIGFECGYQTPSQFVRIFKKLVGMTPSQYRSHFR